MPELEPENEKLQQISVSDSEVNKNPPSSYNGVKEKRKTTSGNFMRGRRTPWFGCRRRRRVVKCKTTLPLTEKNCTDEKMDAEEESSKEKSSNDEDKAKHGSSSSQGSSSSPPNHNARKDNSETVLAIADTSPNVLVNGCLDNDDLETNEKGNFNFLF